MNTNNLHLNRFKILKSLYKNEFGEKENFGKAEYKICNTLFTGYIPNDAEVNMIFGLNEVLPRNSVEEIMLTKLQCCNDFYIFDIFNSLSGTYKGNINGTDLLNGWKKLKLNLSWKVLHESFDSLALGGNLDYETFKMLYYANVAAP